MGGVIAAWEPGRSVTAAWNWRFELVDALGFVLVEVLSSVSGVTVNSVEEHCQFYKRFIRLKPNKILSL